MPEEINITLLLKPNIEDKISKIKSSGRSKNGYIRIGGIQIMIKARFKEGIDDPVNIVVLDKRIKYRKYALFRIIQRHLNYKKLLFKIYPKYLISLKIKNLTRL